MVEDEGILDMHQRIICHQWNLSMLAARNDIVPEYCMECVCMHAEHCLMYTSPIYLIVLAILAFLVEIVKHEPVEQNNSETQWYDMTSLPTNHSIKVISHSTAASN